MDKIEWLYKNGLRNKARYMLGVKGKNILACFGINPSTAKPGDLDNTLKSVSRIAKNNGYDGWIMLNIYPQRSTDPNGIHDTINKSIHRKNLEEIKTIFDEYKIKSSWVAWGTIITKRTYLIECLKDIVDVASEKKMNFISFGKKSKKGHPHHPLYLAGESQPEKFDVENYISTFEEMNYKKRKKPL